MPRTGTRKLAPKDFKKEKTQYCIDAIQPEEVLKKLNGADVRIIGAHIRIGKITSTRRMTVPNKLRKLGVTNMAKFEPTVVCGMTFDEVKPKTIIRNVKAVCKELGIPEDKAFVRHITLRSGNATGRFTITTKEIHPDETDMRKKAKVLALDLGKGKIISELLPKLACRKYHCDVEEILVRTITCR